MSRDPNFKSKDLRETIEGQRLLTKPKAGRENPPPASGGYKKKHRPKECGVYVRYW